MNIEARPAASDTLQSSSLLQYESSAEAYRTIDRVREALTGQMSGGISPAAFAMAMFDWSLHLAAAPG